MTKYFNKLKKTLFLAHFWFIFSILGAKNFFPENPALSRTPSYGFLAPYQNLEKAKDTIPRKRPDRRKDGRTEGRKDGQTLFHRYFWLPPGV